MTRWQFMGDVNLEYGGTFYDFSNWQHGYVDAVEITDLDSACGFTGAVLIERITINTERSPEDLHRALGVIGACLLPNGDIDDNGRTIKKELLRTVSLSPMRASPMATRTAIQTTRFCSWNATHRCNSTVGKRLSACAQTQA